MTWLLALAALGCARAEGPRKPAPPAPAPAPAPMPVPVESAAPPAVTAQMHARFGVLTALRDHVVQGRLEEAKTAAASLAALDPPEGLPGPWRPWVAAVDEHAEKAAQAPDLATAASEVGRIAVGCADCHGAMQGGPGLEGAHEIPPQAWDEGQNMPLHKWAVDWMWLGLLGDSDEAWRRGAAELDKQPLVPRFEQAPPGGLRELEQLVYVIANKALETDELEARGELYGNLVATCAQCHSQRPLPAPVPPEAP